jgi:hypothetical protein
MGNTVFLKIRGTRMEGVITVAEIFSLGWNDSCHSELMSRKPSGPHLATCVSYSWLGGGHDYLQATNPRYDLHQGICNHVNAVLVRMENNLVVLVCIRYVEIFWL